MNRTFKPCILCTNQAIRLSLIPLASAVWRIKGSNHDANHCPYFGGSVMDPQIPDSVRQRLQAHDAPKMHLDDRYVIHKR